MLVRSRFLFLPQSPLYRCTPCVTYTHQLSLAPYEPVEIMASPRRHFVMVASSGKLDLKRSAAASPGEIRFRRKTYGALPLPYEVLDGRSPPFDLTRPYKIRN